MTFRACYHGGGPALDHRLDEGTRDVGVVVCVHDFGVGMWLLREEQFGHANMPQFDKTAPGRSPSERDWVWPSIGDRFAITTYHYMGPPQHQLRLGVVSRLS